MYASTDYKYRFSHWAVVDIIPQDVVGKHQSMIAWRMMDISTVRPFHVYEANFSSKAIVFTKNIVAAYDAKAPGDIVRPSREEPFSKQQEKKDSGTRDPCITTNAVQENATETQKEKETRSSIKYLYSKSTKIIDDESASNTVPYSPSEND